MDFKIEFCLLSHNEIELYFSSLLAELLCLTKWLLTVIACPYTYLIME